LVFGYIYWVRVVQQSSVWTRYLIRERNLKFKCEKILNSVDYHTEKQPWKWNRLLIGKTTLGYWIRNNDKLCPPGTARYY
jgi:hypothetical protein